MGADDCTYRLHSENGQSDDARWRAFRYVLREMPPHEAEEFEQLLASDQAACELVAEYMTLIAELHHVAQGETPCKTGRPVVRAGAPALPNGVRMQRAAVVAVVAAACALLAIGIHVIPLRNAIDLPIPYTDVQPDYGGAGQLVALWSERLAESLHDPGTIEPTAAERADLAAADAAGGVQSTKSSGDAAADSASVSDQGVHDEYDVPGWMIAAVSLEESWNPDSTPSGMREN